MGYRSGWVDLEDYDISRYVGIGLYGCQSESERIYCLGGLSRYSCDWLSFIIISTNETWATNRNNDYRLTHDHQLLCLDPKHLWFCLHLLFRIDLTGYCLEITIVLYERCLYCLSRNLFFECNHKYT